MTFDAEMIRHAAARGLVQVEAPKPFQARLVCWRPFRHGTRTFTARIEFPSGGRLTVSAGLVSIVEETP